MLLPAVRESLVVVCTPVVRECIYSLPGHILRHQSTDEWFSDAWVLTTEIATGWRPGGEVPLDRYVKLFLRDRLFRLIANRARHGEQFQPCEPAALRDVPDPRPSSNDFLGALWDDPDFVAARKHLSWRDRIILALRHFEGFTQAQIAEAFDLQERMVRYILADCYETLSQHLELTHA